MYVNFVVTRSPFIPLSCLRLLTGYGPSTQWQNLVFDGDKRKYKLWEAKIRDYLKLMGLKEVFGVGKISTNKNELAFAELV